MQNAELRRMKKLEKNLVGIYRALLNKEFTAKKVSEDADPTYRLSAMNLVRYITLRNQDLRGIHDLLSDLGISSLRTCEGYVMHNVTAALRLVKLLNSEDWEPDHNIEMVGYRTSKKLIQKHTKQLFNKRKNDRLTRIMATLPSSTNPIIIRDMISQGMEIARLDLNKGNLEEWTKTVKHIKDQRELLNKQCMIFMDLAGPDPKIGKIDIKVSNKKSKKFIRLKKGDHLFITKEEVETLDNIRGARGIQLQIPKVSVSDHAVIDRVKVGDRIFFDNGKLESRIIKRKSDQLEIIIISHSEKGTKLKSEASLSFPDSRLKADALTPEDKAILPFVIKNADILGFSNVRTRDDIKALYQELTLHGPNDIGIILNITNQEAFDNLPMLLLEAMKRPRLGVMISRSNLAFDIGAERIAEIQDQIMWFCEAAHIPVIWATEVLETLNMTGKATRAEITDAAKSALAECVMLGDGPYILDALSTLSNILQKMEGHTSKKKSVMRALKISAKNMDKLGVS